MSRWSPGRPAGARSAPLPSPHTATSRPRFDPACIEIAQGAPHPGAHHKGCRSSYAGLVRYYGRLRCMPGDRHRTQSGRKICLRMGARPWIFPKPRAAARIAARGVRLRLGEPVKAANQPFRQRPMASCALPGHADCVLFASLGFHATTRLALMSSLLAAMSLIVSASFRMSRVSASPHVRARAGRRPVDPSACRPCARPSPSGPPMLVDDVGQPSRPEGPAPARSATSIASLRHRGGISTFSMHRARTNARPRPCSGWWRGRRRRRRQGIRYSDPET